MRYVIIGNGVAGTSAAEEVRKKDPQGTIILLTDEALSYYSRIRLIEYVAGTIDQEALLIRKKEWYDANKIDLRLKTRVVAADLAAKVIHTQDQEQIFFDRLLIASGSHSFIPPIKGMDKRGVFALRNIADAQNIVDHAQKTKHVVIVGGGLIGLEVGHSLIKLGKTVTVMVKYPWLMKRQLNAACGSKLLEIMKDMGFSFRFEAQTEELLGGEAVSAVRLKGGETLPAEMVIVSAGVRPNLEIAHDLKLAVNNGIIVDPYLKTSATDIFAAGDVAEFNGTLYGIWPAAQDQGKAAGINMADGRYEYKGTVRSHILKVTGIELASAGNIDTEDQLLSYVEAGEGFYRRIVLDRNQVVGCMLLGDKKGFGEILAAIKTHRDLADDPTFLERAGFKNIH